MFNYFPGPISYNINLDPLKRLFRGERFQRAAASSLLLGGLAIFALEVAPHEAPSISYNQAVDACGDQLGYAPVHVAEADVPAACERFEWGFYDRSVDLSDNKEYELPTQFDFVRENTVGEDYDESVTRAHYAQAALLGLPGAVALGALSFRRRLQEVDVVREAETLLWAESEQ